MMGAAELAERLVGSPGDRKPYILLEYLERRADDAEVWPRPTRVRMRRG